MLAACIKFLKFEAEARIDHLAQVAMGVQNYTVQTMRSEEARLPLRYTGGLFIS